jgi:hypothetical protein
VTKLERVLRRVAIDLDAMGVPWTLVGGIAVAARAEPRLTRDVDVAIAAPDDEAAEQVVFELQRRGYTVAAALEHTRAGRLATVRLSAPEPGRSAVLVDLLFASCGIEPEVVVASSRLRILGRATVPVARAGHLMAMKMLALDRRRPQDHDDIVALLAASPPSEIEVAEDAMRLIRARGYSRGRDLVRRFRALRKRASGSKGRR